MYRAIIVDDETISRIGIRSIIDWSKYEFEVIAQASNGEEALELIKEHKPDLVFTDMNMPKLDGIGLIRSCVEQNLDVEFIIISAHNDFEYVKEGLKLGALDYILKNNISEEKMSELLKTCHQKIDEKKTKINVPIDQELSLDIIKHAKHNYLKSLLFGTKGFEEMDEELLKKYEIELTKSRVVVMVIKNEGDVIQFSHQMITNTIEGLVLDYDGLYFSLTGRGEITLLYNYDYHSDAKDNEVIRKIANRFVFVIKQYFNTNISIYVSDIFTNISSVPLAYLQACQAYNSRYVLEDMSIVYYEDIKDQHSMIYDENFEQTLRTFKKAIDRNDGNTCIESFDVLIAQIEKNTELSRGQLQYYMSALLYMIKEYATDKSLLNVEAVINEYKNLTLNKETTRKKEVLDSLKALKDKFVLDLRDRENCSIYVIKIKEYIRKNYNHKISLEDLADQIGLSYTYMSTLFKKEVGENIMDFLIGCRIEAAKKMLVEGQYQISYISSSVGYENEHYFSRMFKQRTNMTPTAYRQSRT